MSYEWFTRSTWTEADQADFHARLKRSRGPGNKAQYLVRQANYLERVGSPELLRAAITLLDKMLTEFPEPFFLAEARCQKANCLGKLGKLDDAVAQYRLALEAERKFPNHRTQTLHEFGIFVAENKLSHLYDEALAVLDEMKLPGTQFPCDIFRGFGIRALIAADRGDTDGAIQFAQTALNAAGKDSSGFLHHPGFGLVKNRESKFYKAIEAIAAKHIQSLSS